MSITFVAKPVKNASIMTAILLRVDTTKNMLTTHYNIYIILLKRGTSVGSVCTFISALGFLNATCPLDPGFDAMYLVTVQWRQNRTITCILVNARTATTPHLIYSKFRGGSGRNGWVDIENGRGRWPREFPGLYESQTMYQPPKRFRLRHTKPPSSPNCKQHRLGELGRHGRRN